MRSKFFTTFITSLIALGFVLAATARAQQPVQWPHGKKAAIVDETAIRVAARFTLACLRCATTEYPTYA